NGITAISGAAHTSHFASDLVCNDHNCAGDWQSGGATNDAFETARHLCKDGEATRDDQQHQWCCLDRAMDHLRSVVTHESRVKKDFLRTVHKLRKRNLRNLWMPLWYIVAI